MQELHKRRRTLTEPEVRYWMRQIVEATQFMHSSKVIHRDLKLGNLFINSSMKIKVGDFGLATTIQYDGERKKTLCGTPNYIAPEILNRGAGHSFPVDIWSIGCILYTLLCGKPPFETSNIESTYRKIRTNDYEIPAHLKLSESAKDLIRWTLHADPSRRPTLEEISQHDFMANGFCPETLSRSALKHAPSFPEEATATKTKVAKGGGRARRPLGEVTNSPAPQARGGGSKPGSKVRTATRRQLSEMLTSLRSVIARQAKASDAAVPSPVSAEVKAADIWLSKWVDYSNKYGLGYQLSTGSVGVLFNDATKMILAPDGVSVQLVERDSQGAGMALMSTEKHPPELLKKVTLLNYFKSYMEEHLLGSGDGAPELDQAQLAAAALPHVAAWTRTSSAIIFRLSNGVLQMNFFDHAKLVVNAGAGTVTYIDHDRCSTTYAFDSIAGSASRDGGFLDMLSRIGCAADVVEQMLKPGSV